MRPRTPLSLRTQLAIALAVAVLVTALFGYIGLGAASAWYEAGLQAELGEPGRRALEELDANRVPQSADLAALLEAAARVDARAGAWSLAVLAVLCGLAVLIGAVASYLWATRLTDPIGAVTAAAGRVAAGDLAARATPRRRGAGELARLVEDFNRMADALQASDAELTYGAAAIAHELRTPLTILRGRLQGMLDGVFPARPDEIGGLIRQVELLARIVDDLQLVSIAMAGKLELRRETVDVAAELGALARTLAPDFEAAGMRLETRLEPVSCTVDARRLRQAVLALLYNALRYARDGGEITLHAGGVGDRVVIRVLDRGPGLSAEAIERVFERFWRAEGSRSREHGGSGLGLSVVDVIARVHGGNARAANRDGGGAVFEIDLPRDSV